jgi:hypothetical protein
MKECKNCRWCTPLTDSLERNIYICLDANSGAYMEETGICGNCDLEDETDENV